MTIEPMRIEDFDEILPLWQKTEGVGLNESDSRENIGHYLERNPGLSLVARDDQGKIVGAVLCGHDGRRGCLYHLAIASAYRRRGIGRQMVETCLAKLAALGILKCNILMYVDNAAARAFWERYGWKQRVELCLLQRDTTR